MSDYMTRFAVVVKDIYHNKSYEEPYYTAVVISNSQNGKMTPEGTTYTFGRTNGETEFWEADNEKQANRIADKFNRLYQKGVYVNIRQLAQ